MAAHEQVRVRSAPQGTRRGAVPGFAHLKNWRPGKVRTNPRWATALVRALLVLMNREVAR
ncbi:hypothetical protein ACRAWF_20815 [Streptomyces sp. L7]